MLDQHIFNLLIRINSSLNISGTATLNSLSVSNPTTCSSSLNVSGKSGYDIQGEGYSGGNGFAKGSVADSGFGKVNGVSSIDNSSSSVGMNYLPKTSEKTTGGKRSRKKKKEMIIK